jgi:hypothetical protein
VSNYSVMLFRFEPVPSEVSYAINLFRSDMDVRVGANPGRNFTQRAEFLKALKRLDIPLEMQGQILETLYEKGFDHIHGHPLSDEIAAEFGWPTK